MKKLTTIDFYYLTTIDFYYRFSIIVAFCFSTWVSIENNLDIVGILETYGLFLIVPFISSYFLSLYILFRLKRQNLYQDQNDEDLARKKIMAIGIFLPSAVGMALAAQGMFFTR